MALTLWRRIGDYSSIKFEKSPGAWIYSDRHQISAENCIAHPQHCQKTLSNNSWNCSCSSGLNTLESIWCKIWFLTHFWQWNIQLDIHFIVESSLDIAIWTYSREKFPKNQVWIFSNSAFSQNCLDFLDKCCHISVVVKCI